MAIFLREADAQKLLPMDEALTAVEAAFKEHGSGTAVNLSRERAQAGSTNLTMMVAAIGGLGVSGFKSLGYVLLHSTAERKLLAVMEARVLGQIRTGAASGVATKFMAREDASTVGIIGTGFQAETQLEAICAVRPIKTVHAFSRTKERREAYAEKMSAALNVDVTPVDSGQAAVAGKDIAVAIASPRTLDPVLLGEWVAPGTHLVAAGANSLTRRELDDAAVAGAAAIAVDSMDQAKLECADLTIPISKGMLAWGRVAQLGQIVTGQIAGRTSADQTTLYESQGIALEDVAVAAHIYDRAVKEGVGEQLPF